MAERFDSGVDQFLLDHIDTVPHLEALLLLWNSRPKLWPVESMAKALFLTPQSAKGILDDLARQHLIVATSGTYHYEAEPGLDSTLAFVESAYRRDLIRITQLIHSKPPAALREFARAFRLKKDKQ